jgi:hypothetical protein
VPRKYDDEMPRRRGSKRAAIDVDEDRGLALRIFLYSPKDMIAGAFALAAVIAIITNALFMQAGRHPAPMSGSATTLPAVASASVNPLPRPRPVEADASLPETGLALPRFADPLASLVKATGSVQPPSMNIPRPPLAVPVSSRTENIAISPGGSQRVAAIQRVLTAYGYGQLKPTGLVGADTQTAILKFERMRKLPVTGQVSDRLVRELAASTGHPVE